jgi:hypothetical protein
MNTDIGLARGTQEEMKPLADMASRCEAGIGYPGSKGLPIIPALHSACFNY